MLTIAGRDDCPMTILSARPTSPASVDAGLVSQALVSQAVVSQAPAAVLMVRPHHFRPNVEECPDNHFMSLPTLTPIPTRTSKSRAYLITAITRLSKSTRQSATPHHADGHTDCI